MATTATKTKTRSRVNEQFDLNRARLAGTIIRLWGRNGDVFGRLRVSTRGELPEADDAHSCYVNIRVPNGTLNGSPVTLQQGDVARVAGYAAHTSYEETLRKFLSVAGESRFLDLHIPPDDLDAWRSIQFKRSNAIVNAQSIELIPTTKKKAKNEAINSIDLEGIVARTWEYRRDDSIERFARLAIYDQFAPIAEGRNGRNGRPFRQPHYVNVLLPSNGRTVNVALKQRIRVIGEFRDRGHRVTLRESLMSLGSTDAVDLMGRVINAEIMDQISVQQESLHVMATAVVVYG
jgi:hypothetical protein